MDADGSRKTNLTNHPAIDHSPAWSPDHRRIAFASDRDSGDAPDIYVMNADGSGVSRLTTDPARDAQPSWSPDGNRIAFTRSDADSLDGVYVMKADGSGQARLTEDVSGSADPAWSPNGARIALWGERFEDDVEEPEIYLVNPDGSDVIRLTQSPEAPDGYPAWSPDGKQIAFSSRRANRFDLFVMNADGSGVTALTDTAVVEQWPVWSPDGRRIAYTRAGDEASGEHTHLTYVYVMNADGSQAMRLAGATQDDPSDIYDFNEEPDW
jgi:TolB protein